MVKVECVIRPAKLDDVLEAVREAGASGMTVTDVIGFGRQRGRTERYRGAEYTVMLQPKVKIEIVVPDEAAEALVAAIAKAARTGEVGDGKVFVTDVHSLMRIRTGERGPDAL